MAFYVSALIEKTQQIDLVPTNYSAISVTK